MRNYISCLYSGNTLPLQKEIYFLSNGGSLLPTKYISINFYKEHRVLLSFAFDNAQDGSTLLSVARDAFPFSACVFAFFPLQSSYCLLLCLTKLQTQYHKTL